MPGRPTEIYRAANSQHAQMLREMLEERGIKAYVVNEALQAAGGDLPMGWTAAPQILVAEEDAVKGRLIAEQFEAVLRDGDAISTDDFEVAEADWADWPLCPGCQQRREAVCNVCGSKGTKFALADQKHANGQTQVLLFCDTCDDHFRPQFLPTCRHCGHDFGSDNSSPSPRQEVEHSTNTGLIWLVTVALLAFSAAIGGYFWWLMSSRPG